MTSSSWRFEISCDASFLTQSLNGEESLLTKKFSDSDSDLLQNVINSSSSDTKPVHQVSTESVDKLFDILLTDKQAGVTEEPLGGGGSNKSPILYQKILLITIIWRFSNARTQEKHTLQAVKNVVLWLNNKRNKKNSHPSISIRTLPRWEACGDSRPLRYPAPTFSSRRSPLLLPGKAERQKWSKLLLISRKAL